LKTFGTVAQLWHGAGQLSCSAPFLEAAEASPWLATCPSNMDKPKLTQNRIILAFAIAVIADLVQFPITAVTATGLLSVQGELADFLVDCVVMVATTMLLGFHWVLLPSLFLEAIPGVDLLPTWTACVAYVVWRRRKEQAQPPPLCPIVDVQDVQVISERPTPPT
jgi:hypothetical protein